MATTIITLILGSITSFFAFLAYLNTRHKFRLELLDKRWGVYRATTEFCGLVFRYGRIPRYGDDGVDEAELDRLHNAAHNSFRGEGFHLTKILFGKDIQEKFDELNLAYAWLVSFPPSSDNAEKHQQQMEIVIQLTNEMPSLFAPYMNFGQFRADKWFSK